MRNGTILIVGHSHTACVARALRARTHHWAAPAGLCTHVVNLMTFMPTLGLTFNDVLLREPASEPRLRREVVAEIERGIVPGSHVHVVSMVGGNVHNFLGLMRAPIPFDFVLPEAPDLPLEAGARIIPYSAMQACLEELMRDDRATLAALRRQFSGVLLHLESPPPPRDDAYVVQWLGTFRDFNDTGEIVSATLRYKLWRLHSTIVKRFCHDLGIILAEAPLETRDAEGFLARQAYQDATHANAWYGSRLVGQLEAFAMSHQFERAA